MKTTAAVVHSTKTSPVGTYSFCDGDDSDCYYCYYGDDDGDCCYCYDGGDDDWVSSYHQY